MDLAKGITVEYGISLLVAYSDTREVLIEIAALNVSYHEVLMREAYQQVWVPFRGETRHCKRWMLWVEGDGHKGAAIRRCLCF